MWFSTALGVTAPHNGTDSWLDLATDVLTHRALYAITDPVLALGPEPDTTASTTERSVYRRLTSPTPEPMTADNHDRLNRRGRW